MANFDLSALALKAVCPTNEILYDDKGLPSVMVYIPKFKLSAVIDGASDSIHPAFIVNGKEIDGFYVSKYQNIVKDSRAYSLPCEDPRANINLNTAIQYCNNKGEGWHCMTRAEWAAIALWCKKNGTQPKGNNNYGKDVADSTYDGIPTTYDSSTGNILHIATGSGPLSYSHNGELSGIWDLNGNVSEWQGGLRTVYGEIQILANNNAADEDNDQGASSAQWMAIDAATGNLVTPAGDGSTTGTVKVDWQSNHAMLSTNITTRMTEYKSCTFATITADSNIGDNAKELLKALCLLPADSDASAYNGDMTYWNNGEAERAFYAGGNYTIGSSAGVFYLYGLNARSSSGASLGFRSAFVSLPTE